MMAQGDVLVRRPDYLEPDQVAYFQRVRQANTVNGIFGIKIHFPQLKVLAGGADALVRLLPGARYLSITRRRTLRQAVSYARAAQSGVWRVGLRQRRHPRFNHLRIIKHLLFVAQEVEQWEQFYDRHGIAPLRLVYEDFDEQYEDTLGRVIEFLGLSSAIPPKPLAKQADHTTEEWVERSVRFLRGEGVVMRTIRRIATTW
jgi:LPS sulfotransferase NodH